MVVGWLAHRRLTFAVDKPPSVPVFAAYAGLAWTSAALNYAVYAAILLARPATAPVAAVFVASVVAMAASYLGMRFAVFRRR
jgi:putative flippase GtrA